jgi:hypothetical protein
MGRQMESELRVELSAKINQHLAEHPRITLRGLARRSGLSSMTLSRLQAAEVLKPSFEATVAILRVVQKDQEFSDFLKRHFPNTMDTFDKYYSPEAYQPMSSPELSQAFKDALSYTLFELCLLPGGISSKVVLNQYGQVGIQCINNLVMEGLVQETSDKKFVPISNRDITILFSNVRDVLQALTYRLQSFNVKNIGSKAARIASFSFALSREGVEKVHSILTDAIKDIQSIQSDVRFQGPYPAYVGTFLNLVVGSLDEPGALEDPIHHNGGNA